MDANDIPAVDRYFLNLDDADPVPDVNEITADLYGTKWVVGGYNAQEAIERHNHSRAMLRHGSESMLWYRGLSLHLAALYGEWPELPEGTSAERIGARCAQADLLGICLSTSKVAIDALLSGYVSVASAGIRNMFETVLHCENLFEFPEDAAYFYELPTKLWLDRMRVGEIRIRLVNRFGGTDDVQPGSKVEYINDLYDGWKCTSSGSHPSPVGVGLSLAQSKSPSRQIGSNYQAYATLQGFERGLKAFAGAVQATGPRGCRLDITVSGVARRSRGTFGVTSEPSGRRTNGTQRVD